MARELEVQEQEESPRQRDQLCRPLNDLMEPKGDELGMVVYGVYGVMSSSSPRVLLPFSKDKLHFGGGVNIN
ncbi:Hypothetical protein NTJ_07906 [Nesidiocoris tenuis]|uniref:Uncharacterized protein n=1 Tax=Nesidiocoris tenuis TaxID=355587 RepID=A0ABN7ASD5_9HEMI|nr:Hypothetical protein NTJ_07906 [Nesidiocoris tenuis]